MIKHHTKNKGDLGVLKVKVDLFEQGYLILNPETEHAPFDIVAYRNGQFHRIQVKYRNLTASGVLEIPFRNSYSTSKGVKSITVNKCEVDFYAIYCPQTDLCYYFNPKAFNKSLTLRVKTSLNSQQKGIHFAEEFRKVP
jgi:PD-(D/E)XK endonuclease